MTLFLLTLLTAWLCTLVLPWWSIVIPGLVFGFQFEKKGWASFGWGFLALFVLWGGQALYIHMGNDGILSTRIAIMLGVGSPYLVILVTGLVGGLVSGLATLTGGLLKSSFGKED